MQRGCDSVRTVVGREKRRESIHPYWFSLVSGAKLVAALMPWRQGVDGSYIPFLAPGEQQHPRFSTLNPEERPNRLEAFPGRYLLLTSHFLKPVLRSSSYLRNIAHSFVHLDNTVVFLP